MRIAIAGGGWYGCHIASVLKDQCAQLHLYEKNDALFSEASGNNQFRLHQGLHYPRSGVTRHQSRDGYFRFSERYPGFSHNIKENYYLIPHAESLLDYDTYFSIMFSSGLNIEKVPVEAIPHILPEKFEGAIKCQEKGIETTKARSFFEKNLSQYLLFNEPVRSVERHGNKVQVNGKSYDYFIDSTWGALPVQASRDLFYESTILLYYEYVGDGVFPALTLVDGQLWSIYPTETPRIYTLSSVPFTPIATYATKQEAYDDLTTVGDALVREKIQLMEQQVKTYFPTFNEHFKYIGPQFAIKTKPRGKVDNRSASVLREDRCFHVQSGKIDNIFQAADYILGEIMLDQL